MKFCCKRLFVFQKVCGKMIKTKVKVCLCAVILFLLCAKTVLAGYEGKSGYAYIYSWNVANMNPGPQTTLGTDAYKELTNPSILNDGQITREADFTPGVQPWCYAMNGSLDNGVFFGPWGGHVTFDLGNAKPLGEVIMHQAILTAHGVGAIEEIHVTIDGGAPIRFAGFDLSSGDGIVRQQTFDLTGHTGRVVKIAFATVTREWTSMNEVIFLPPGKTPLLYTPKSGYNLNDHIVSASVFHWYISGGGQVSGPWLPLEGRANWTGEVAWWKSQIKQMMTANIQVLFVELIPFMEQQRINLFQALGELRKAGYDVPKVVPFLDPVITWSIYGTPPDLSTTAGKDAFVNEYIRFFQQYYSVNTDAYADNYLATIGGKVVLDSYSLATLTNVGSLTRNDVESRLASAFSAAHPVFNQGIYMIKLVAGPDLVFTDEKIVQFENNSYYQPYTYNGVTSAMVKPGFWNQNVENPGAHLARNDGSDYTSAWNAAVANRNTVKHAYIESWNEYDEGSGIYAVDIVNSPYVIPPNSGTDSWSDVDDPYEYIRTTANGARSFNDISDYGFSVLYCDFPDYMYPGEHKTVRVIVRNEGDLMWSENDLFRFGQKEYLQGETLFGTGRYTIDNTANEVDIYGGVCRGRPVTFEFELTAPQTEGTYVTHWGMVQENVTWFGPELVHTFSVVCDRIPGDLNVDCVVDFADVAIMMEHWLEDSSTPAR